MKIWTRVKRVRLLNIWSWIMYTETVLELKKCTFLSLQKSYIHSTLNRGKGTKSNGTTTKSHSLLRLSPKDFLFAKVSAIWYVQSRDEVNLWANLRKSCMTIATLKMKCFAEKIKEAWSFESFFVKERNIFTVRKENQKKNYNFKIFRLRMSSSNGCTSIIEFHRIAIFSNVSLW